MPAATDRVSPDAEARCSAHGGPSPYAHIEETAGLVGLITPLTHKFCEGCNRVRLTAVGVLHTPVSANTHGGYNQSSQVTSLVAVISRRRSVTNSPSRWPRFQASSNSSSMVACSLSFGMSSCSNHQRTDSQKLNRVCVGWKVKSAVKRSPVTVEKTKRLVGYCSLGRLS